MANLASMESTANSSRNPPPDAPCAACMCVGNAGRRTGTTCRASARCTTTNEGRCAVRVACTPCNQLAQTLYSFVMSDVMYTQL